MYLLYKIGVQSLGGGPEWEKKRNHSSQKFVQNLKNKLLETQEKLDKLVSAYIDGDIPKENYLAKKEELLKQKVSLANDLEDFGRTGKNWLQPLRAWILDANKAENCRRATVFLKSRHLSKRLERTPYFWTNPFPFLFARRGILWLCALRKARMPSGEAARQPFPKTAKVAIGGVF